MKSFALFFGAILVAFLTLSNGAPQDAELAVSPPMGRPDGQLGVPFNDSVGPVKGGLIPGKPPGLVKRDLVNQAPIAHHIHTASCNGGGQGGPRPNGTTSG